MGVDIGEGFGLAEVIAVDFGIEEWFSDVPQNVEELLCKNHTQ